MLHSGQSIKLFGYRLQSCSPAVTVLKILRRAFTHSAARVLLCAGQPFCYASTDL